MILLRIKLIPSVIAKRFVLFQVLRAFSLAGVVVCVLLLPVALGVAALLVCTLIQVGYYFYLYRLVLCIFTLAQLAEGEGQPVGRPSIPPEEYPPDLSEYQDENGILIF